MDETREEICAWIGVILGGFLCYRGVTAIVTRHAYLGRRAPIRFDGGEAVTFGWIALGVGLLILALAAAYFWNEKRR